MTLLISILTLLAVVVIPPSVMAQDVTEITPAVDATAVIEPALLPEPPASPEAVVATDEATIPPASAPDDSAGSDVPVATTAKPDLAFVPSKTEPFLYQVQDSSGNEIDVNKIDSLFFSKWEHDLLVDARRGLTTRPVTPGDMGGEIAAPTDNTVFGPREVMLSGIAYVSPDDWTIWVNQMRITPTAIPTMVMDLKVYKDHIDLEWLDQGANKIYPIRLRPYQKFNLDTRMFLPAGG